MGAYPTRRGRARGRLKTAPRGPIRRCRRAVESVQMSSQGCRESAVRPIYSLVMEAHSRSAEAPRGGETTDTVAPPSQTAPGRFDALEEMYAVFEGDHDEPLG